MKTASWIVAIILAVFFVAFGLNKFLGFLGDPAPIFEKAGGWLGMADFFTSTMIYIVGAAEIVAGLMILNPGSRRLGAFLGLGIVGAALVFHLFSPLGIEVELPTGEMREVFDVVSGETRQEPEIAGDGGQLFITAIVAFVLSAMLFFMGRGEAAR